MENSSAEGPPAEIRPSPTINVKIISINKYYAWKMDKFYNLKTFPLGLREVVLYPNT